MAGQPCCCVRFRHEHSALVLIAPRNHQWCDGTHDGRTSQGRGADVRILSNAYDAPRSAAWALAATQKGAHHG